MGALTAAGDFIATGDIRISSWGNRCIVCCERGGLRHPSILRASAGRRADAVTVEPVGEFILKGIGRPLAAYNVLAAAPPNA
jgi:hypothetical protein